MSTALTDRRGYRRPAVHTITSARPARGRPTGRPAARPPVRMTRRGRLLLVLALVVLVFSLVSLGRAGGWALAASDTSGSGGPVATEWVVQPGETLWQVAAVVAPDTDPRETVARIVELNGLPDASIRVGQRLLVPA